jgi:tRNA nucleotidyltransferase/poly(A) polymerase
MNLPVSDWYHLIPPPVQAIFEGLQKAGFVCFLVGGAVRDLLLGLTPKDFDLVTNAKPEEVEALFPKTIAVGKAFGIIVVVQDGMSIEVATFRKDGDYEDGRRPNEVIFASPEEDALRRDFTMNALFWDPATRTVIDYVGGKEDIQNRLIRTVGEPRLRFREDALRMLRALRFEVQLQSQKFHLSEEIIGAISDLKENLLPLSRERITQEFNLIWRSSAAPIALQRLYDSNIWSLLLPNTDFGLLVDSQNIESVLTGSKEFVLEPLDLYDEKRLRQLLAWCLVRKHTPPEHYKDLEQFFLFAREESQTLKAIPELAHKIKLADAHNMSQYKLLLANENFFLAALFVQVLSSEDRSAIQHLRARQLLHSQGRLHPPPLLTGKDLIALGIQPGPQVKEILDRVYEAQLEEKIFTREEALKLAAPIHK